MRPRRSAAVHGHRSSRCTSEVRDCPAKSRMALRCFTDDGCCLLRPQAAVPSRSNVKRASEPASAFGYEVIESGITPRREQIQVNEDRSGRRRSWRCRLDAQQLVRSIRHGRVACECPDVASGADNLYAPHECRGQCCSERIGGGEVCAAPHHRVLGAGERDELRKVGEEQLKVVQALVVRSPVAVGRRAQSQERGPHRPVWRRAECGSVRRL